MARTAVSVLCSLLSRGMTSSGGPCVRDASFSERRAEAMEDQFMDAAEFDGAGNGRVACGEKELRPSGQKDQQPRDDRLLKPLVRSG